MQVDAEVRGAAGRGRCFTANLSKPSPTETKIVAARHFFPRPGLKHPGGRDSGSADAAGGGPDRRLPARPQRSAGVLRRGNGSKSAGTPGKFSSMKRSHPGGSPRRPARSFHPCTANRSGSPRPSCHPCRWRPVRTPGVRAPSMVARAARSRRTREAVDVAKPAELELEQGVARLADDPRPCSAGREHKARIRRSLRRP